jgi:hypothetical protein
MFMIQDKNDLYYRKLSNTLVIDLNVTDAFLKISIEISVGILNVHNKWLLTFFIFKYEMHRSMTCLIINIRLVDTIRISSLTTYLLTKEHMPMIVVKSIVVHMKGQSTDLSIDHIYDKMSSSFFPADWPLHLFGHNATLTLEYVIKAFGNYWNKRYTSIFWKISNHCV